MEKTMEKIIALAKSRGFIYPGSEIYGGLANTSVPGSQKNSSSSCSNSLVRKVKFPGEISFRKAFPICPIPKGIFFLEVLCTFLKFTKIPCAVSGRK